MRVSQTSVTTTVVLVATAAFILAVVWLLFLSEDMTESYETTVEAIEDGAFERGWLPDVLIPDTTMIDESHNIDTNIGKAAFRFTDQLVSRCEAVCVPLTPNLPLRSPFKSWPEFLKTEDTPDSLAAKDIRSFQCRSIHLVAGHPKKTGGVLAGTAFRVTAGRYE